jgi:hypothetical protein
MGVQSQDYLAEETLPGQNCPTLAPPCGQWLAAAWGESVKAWQLEAVSLPCFSHLAGSLFLSPSSFPPYLGLRALPVLGMHSPTELPPSP